MKFSILITLFIGSSICLRSQITYQTISNGLWSSPSSWSTVGVPPINLSVQDTIIINNVISYDVNQEILGLMLITLTGSVTGSNTLFIGKGGINSGELINYGSISIDELVCEPDDCIIPYNPVDSFPVINNFGVITATNKISIGQDCGSGWLCNHLGGQMFTDELKVSGYLCNYDSIFVSSEVEVEGGSIDCCGYIQTPYLSLEENESPDRAAYLKCQRFCTATGGTPVIEIDGETVLVPNIYLNANPTHGVVTPLTTFCDLVLPIELVYFNVKLVNSRLASITWTTSSEKNNDFFTIEKSIDNINWETISTVPGAGNSQSQIDYQINDLNPYSGISYYRLIQTDFNGKSDVFKVKSINSSDLNDEYVIYPNPVSFDLFVDYNITDVKELQVYSIFGENLTQEAIISQVNQNRFKIDVSLLLDGVYYIKINSHTKKFVKK